MLKKIIINNLLAIKKTLIGKTKHHSTDADSSNDTKKIQLVGQNFLKNKLFLAQQFYTLPVQKFSNLRQLLSLTSPQGFQKSKIGHWTS